jgi:sugar diacid utilization regulator
MNESRAVQTAYRDTADIVSALLRGTGEPFSAEGVPRLPQGSPLSWPITLILVELTDAPAMQVTYAVRSVLTARDTIFAIFNGDLVIVTNAPNPDRLANMVWEKLGASFGRKFSIVISSPIPSPDKVPAEYQSLGRCLNLLLCLGQQGRVVFEKSLSIYALLFNNKDGDAVDLFVKSTIGVLIDYDARRGSQLSATLLTFFDNGRSLQKTADQLGIHVNTVRQRLDTITQLSRDWDHPSRVLEVHVALRLHTVSSR